jgi:hypothetical protein
MVDVSIIDYALYPPIGLQNSFFVTASPFTYGSHTFTVFNGVTPVATTHGLYVTIDSVPLPWGMDDGWQGPVSENGDRYVPRVGQVVVQHQLGSGLWVTTQYEDIAYNGQMLQWDVALPGRIGLFVEPGCQLQLYYLL